MRGIAVSSRSAIGGLLFSSFWLTAFGKGRYFTVLCGIAALFMCALLSNKIYQYFLDLKLNAK